MFNWTDQVATGKQGERRVMDWLMAQGWNVIDETDLFAWQARDIDCHIWKPESGPWAVEIKTDTHPPKNLFVELTVDGKPGYLYKTRADILLYYFPKAETLFWLSPAALAWWVHEHPGLRRIPIQSRRGKSTWSAEGIAVPVADLGDMVREYHMAEALPPAEPKEQAA